MKAAPCSWRTGTNWIDPDRSSASFRSSVSSPGMPKTYSTPSFSRQRTKSSAARAMAPVYSPPGGPPSAVGAVDPVAAIRRSGHGPLLVVQLFCHRVVVRVAELRRRARRELAVHRLSARGHREPARGVVARGAALPLDDRRDAGAHRRRPVRGRVADRLSHAEELGVDAGAEVAAGAGREEAVEAVPASGLRVPVPGSVLGVDVDVAAERVERSAGARRREPVDRVPEVGELAVEVGVVD